MAEIPENEKYEVIKGRLDDFLNRFGPKDEPEAEIIELPTQPIEQPEQGANDEQA
jgi:hypothetical protein